MDGISMNPASPISETEIFTLVIPRYGNSEVLLESDGESYSLPQVEIPRKRRVAEFLTERVKERWGLDAVCLFDPTWENGASLGWALNYQVLEPRFRDWIPPATLRWMRRSSISARTFKCPDHFQALRSSLELADAFNSGTREGQFAKAGWMDDLMEWMQPRVQSLGLSLTGSFTQLNASPFFSLIRFETNGSAVWFKAVGEPNLREYEITTRLAEVHSECLPRMIAVRPEWHGWLMAEVEGTSLRDAVDLEKWCRAASTLAYLQVDLAGKPDWLLQIGCKDRRLSRNIDEIDLFLESMVEVMRRQPKTPPQILAHSELLELGKNLKNACHRLECLGIPDSLVHGDFNPANIWITLDQCVFLDWAEGNLGFPFTTFQHLLAFLHRVRPELSAWEEPLREAYMERWKTVLSTEQISEALLLTPLVAVMCYALAGGVWQDPERLQEPNFAKHMRSLVRRMHHEAQKLVEPKVVVSSS